MPHYFCANGMYGAIILETMWKEAKPVSFWTYKTKKYFNEEFFGISH